MHKIMFGKVPPSLTANFHTPRPITAFWKTEYTNPYDLFKSSLVYSGSVRWNSLPGPLRLSPGTETFRSRYMSYTVR